MAAHEYYNPHNSFSTPDHGGFPQPQPAPGHVPGEPPPAYQAFHQSPIPQHHNSSSTYNVAEYKPPANYQMYQQAQQQIPPPQPPRPNSYTQQHPQPPYPQPQTHGGLQVPMPQPYDSHLHPLRAHSEPPSASPADSPHRRYHSHSHPHRHHHSHSRHSRSRSRSRDRDRPRKKDKHSGRNTFLGAFGGGAVGDLIFPGLGTLGGAVLGGWGGHEASKDKKREGSGRPRRRGRSYEDERNDGRRRRGGI